MGWCLLFGIPLLVVFLATGHLVLAIGSIFLAVIVFFTITCVLKSLLVKTVLGDGALIGLTATAAGFAVFANPLIALGIILTGITIWVIR